MHIINFAHPLTGDQCAQIESLTAQSITCVVNVPARFDHAAPFIEQARAVVAAIELSSDEWQGLPLIVNLPSLSAIAALALVEIHGRTGYFPAIIRLRPVQDSMPPQFEVAEIINLNQVREQARKAR